MSDAPDTITVEINNAKRTYSLDDEDTDDEGEGPSTMFERRFADRSALWLRLTDNGNGVSYVPVDDTIVDPHTGDSHAHKAVVHGPYVRRGTYDEHSGHSGWYFNKSETVTAIDAANAVEWDETGGD